MTSLGLWLLALEMSVPVFRQWFFCLRCVLGARKGEI